MHDDIRWMEQAIEVAKENPLAPFGTVLIDSQTDFVAAKGLNRTKENPVLHGEISALNHYAESGFDAWDRLCLYTTAEPCCMCQAAILWSGIPRVVYGTSISSLTKMGWHQFTLSANDVVDKAPFADCEIIGGVLEAECDQLFKKAKK